MAPMSTASSSELIDVVGAHIEKTPGVMSGRARIRGTRVRVMDIVGLVEQELTPAEIAEALPTVSLADIYAALAYYADHLREIEADFEDAARVAAEFRRDNADLVISHFDD